MTPHNPANLSQEQVPADCCADCDPSFLACWNDGTKCRKLHTAAAVGDVAKGGRSLSEACRNIARVQSENAELRARLEDALSAFGFHPDSECDLAAEISRCRDEGRGHFHSVTKLQDKLATAQARIEELEAALRYPRFKDASELLIRAAENIDGACREGWSSYLSPHLRRAAEEIRTALAKKGAE